MARRHYDDQPTPQNLRALWDRIHTLTDQLTEAQAMITEQADTIADLQTELTTTTARADEALLSVGRPIDPVSIAIPVPGPGGNEGGVDDGLGAQGCSQALDDGHVPPGSPLTPITAGMIVCGTGREIGAGWSGPALRAPTATLAQRLTNAEELLRRMIWHLNTAGFLAGRQNNSATTVRFSNDKLTVQIDGVFRAYDTMGAYDDFTSTIQTRMAQVFPARYIADAGIAD